MVRIINTADLQPNQNLPRNDNDWIYNGLDCCVTLEILHELTSQLDNTSSGTYEFSRALQGPILDMSMRGLLVDQSKRNAVLTKYKRDIERLGDQLTVLVKDGIGADINWRSPVQLKNLLYDVMGLPPVRKRNAQGRMAPTVNREALEKLGTYFIAEPIVNHLLALRDLDKKRGFLETGIDSDGRIRTSFNIAGTNTGRLSSSGSEFGTGTNLQNVDRDLREVFVADPGMKFANLDLEQADARNVGAICWNLFRDSRGDSFAGAYLDACEGGDLHTSVCRMAWTNLAWPDDPALFRAVADEIAYRNLTYRDLAKKLGHGTNYYGQPRTMSKHTKVAQRMIEEFQSAYFLAFPCIPLWHKRVYEELRDFHSLTTLFGRRRFFYGRLQDDATLREAIAYSPQSMTADEIDLGILRMWRSNRIQLMLQVHDSILIQYPEDQEEEIIPWALEQLTTRLTLAGGREFHVPTEAKIGWNYGDLSDTNPDGLKKWKGGDDRKRQRKPQTRLSIKGL